MSNNIHRKLFLFVYIGLALDPTLGARKDFRSGDSIQSLDLTTPVPAPSLAVESACKSRVEIYGYPCEEHTVTTQDGYTLSLQRIPNGQSGATAGPNKIPVLLQHGLFMDGITWLLNSPDESLGYILADNGYDVWIANTRGTIYSRNHISLSVDDPAYWDWSWDELVAYDLPANIDYIYQQTGTQSIHYVGHSLGTLIMLASISQHKLLSMLRSAALLCPIAYVNQMSSLVARDAAKIFVAEALYWLGVHEFNPNSQTVKMLLKTICVDPEINCSDMISFMTGPNCCLNSSSVEVFLDHEPQPTSTKNMIHLAQMIRRGTITMYDYGNNVENMSHYGQVDPPAYNISNIPNDLALFFSYGGKDELSDVSDVLHLLDSLQFHDEDKLTVQYQDKYAHADFIMAVNASKRIYNPLMAFFKLQ